MSGIRTFQRKNVCVENLSTVFSNMSMSVSGGHYAHRASVYVCANTRGRGRGRGAASADKVERCHARVQLAAAVAVRERTQKLASNEQRAATHRPTYN